MRRGDVGDDDEDYDEEVFEEEEEEVDVEVEEDEKVAEEEDKRQGMRARALPVDGDPDFDSGPPVDGFEYLRRVRHEANERYPSMVTPISTLGLPSMDSNTFAGCGTRPTPSPT